MWMMKMKVNYLTSSSSWYNRIINDIRVYHDDDRRSCGFCVLSSPVYDPFFPFPLMSQRNTSGVKQKDWWHFQIFHFSPKSQQEREKEREGCWKEKKSKTCTSWPHFVLSFDRICLPTEPLVSWRRKSDDRWSWDTFWWIVFFFPFLPLVILDTSWRRSLTPHDVLLFWR